MTLTHDEQVRASNGARNALPVRCQQPSNHDTVQTTKRMNLIEAFMIEKFGYDPNEAEQILAEQYKAIFYKNLAEEERNILEQKQFRGDAKEAAFKIFTETFSPYVLEKQLNWSDKLTDELTGKKSPTIRELLEETAPAIADALAIKDPHAFKNAIADKYAKSDFVIIWRFDRLTLPDGKFKYGNLNRWLEIAIRFKVKV